MAYGQDFDTIADTVMSMTSSVALPAAARLQFDHAYTFEQGAGNAYDGGVLKYSTNGGTSWTDAGSPITAGDRYDVTPIFASAGNPLAGRRGFVGNSYGYTASQVNLSSLAGSSVRFRFRVGTDEAVGDIGWVVDNVRLYTCAGCSFTISPTSHSFTAAAGTGSVSVGASATSCSWSATSAASWITITSGASGTGAGTVSYSVAAYTGTTSRTGTMTIAGQTFTIAQAPPSSPPSVTVTAPNGGEKLFAGTPYTIQWTGAGATRYDVAFSSDGVTFTAVPGCTALSGSTKKCTWSAPAPVTANGRIRVTARNAGGATLADTSNAAFSIASGAAVVTVTSPNTAVNVGIGSMQQIKWTHNLGAQSFVKIELSRDGGVTYPQVLVAAHKNASATTGTFNWRVAGPATSGAQARIRVTWTNGPTADTSNVSFTIAAPFITLTGPATGSSFGIGATRKPTWTTNLGPLDRVNVQLSTTGIGGAFTTMTGGANIVATTQTASVLVPNTPTTTARLRVVWANPPSGSSAKADNPGNFKVEPAFIRVTAPVAGGLWPIGTAKTITWTHNLGGPDNVEIRLSKDGGATYPIVIVASTPSDGSHAVTVNPSWGSQTTTRIKVTWLKTPSVAGQSANFAIQP